MFVTYQPEGKEPQRWVYRPTEFDFRRARTIEVMYSKLYGERRTWDQFKVDVQQGSAAARLLLLWHFLTLTHSTLRIDDVSAKDGEVKLEYSREELLEMREQAEKAPMPENEREMLLAQMDAEIEDAESDVAGKALVSSSPKPAKASRSANSATPTG